MIPTLLPKEISALLVKGNIIYPEYLDPYLPSEEELQSDLKKSEEEMAAAKERFEAIGGTGEELRVYLKTTESSVYDILTMPADKLRQAKKLSSYQLAQSMIAPRSINTNYTYFLRNGTTPNLVYLDSSFYIHKACLSTAYSTTATAKHYEEMRRNIGYAKLIGEGIYNKYLSSASQYSYFLWGDVLSTSIASGNLSTHQGIDFTYSRGQAVHSMMNGKVTSVKSQFGGYTISIYDSTYNVTFIYMHTQNPVCKVGDTVRVGDKIAEQGLYVNGSQSNTHTHFEAHTGSVTSPSGTLGEIMYSKNPYLLGLYYVGGIS